MIANTFESIRTNLITKLYTRTFSRHDFDVLAIEIFNFQVKFNTLYKEFITRLGINPLTVNRVEDIPFLPIQFYKKYQVKTGEWEAQTIFKSSSTGSLIPSENHLRDEKLYRQNAANCFESFFGELDGYKFYALLPSYLEQGQSSLVFMVDYFMQKNKDSAGGFYLHAYEKLVEAIQNDETDKQIVLFGVSYALLDLAEKYAPDLNGVIVMETGGMKGRGKELPRVELHGILKKKMNLDTIYSEYGMTELMSQAYSRGSVFFQAPRMRVVISDLHDPLELVPYNTQGRINIIDLANIDTCSFIATDDLGIKPDEKHFSILGRTDAGDMRGCNLLYVGNDGVGKNNL